MFRLAKAREEMRLTYIRKERGDIVKENKVS